jgi:hypothetical protein
VVIELVAIAVAVVAITVAASEQAAEAQRCPVAVAELPAQESAEREGDAAQAPLRREREQEDDVSQVVLLARQGLANLPVDLFEGYLIGSAAVSDGSRTTALEAMDAIVATADLAHVFS